MDQAKKRRVKRFISLGCIIAVVIVLFAIPLLSNDKSNSPQASILSGTVSTGSIQNKLNGGGTLAQEETVAISIPASVKLNEFLASNGDMVTAGTPIASVDRVSVMTAISQLQETLEYLSKQIKEASDTGSEESVNALAGGTVKILYAQEGDSVQSVMLEHGALAVLSLDGLMAVDLDTDSALTTGTAVTVTLSDSKEACGRIARNLEGRMTVTLKDDHYDVGQTVQITGADGAIIGSGKLYIYTPWNATAYAGTVKSVHVRVGDQLNSGRTLLKLKDVGYSAAYQKFVDQRKEYEELMQELFEMHQTGIITAPQDGLVSGIDKDSAQLLRNSPLSNSPGRNVQSGFSGMMGQEPTFQLYSLEKVPIAAVTPQNTMTLNITVDQLDISALQIGMAAQVKLNAVRSEAYTAVITKIGNTGTNNGGSSKYTVELTMDRTENMLPGMNATATIILSAANDVLTIPVNALVDNGNQTIVYTGYDEESNTLLNPVTVTVGASDGETVEILEGLAKGQTYYYSYYDTPEDALTPDFGSYESMFG